MQRNHIAKVANHYKTCDTYDSFYSFDSCRSPKELCMNLNGSPAEEQDLPRKSLDEAEAVGFDLGLKPWMRSGQGRVL